MVTLLCLQLCLKEKLNRHDFKYNYLYTKHLDKSGLFVFSQSWQDTSDYIPTHVWTSYY